MKFKIYHLLLLPFFISFLFMSLPFFHYLKNEAKREMKYKIFRNKLNDSDLYQFTENELKSANWIDAKEFVLDGKLYDLVEIQTTGSKKTYHCFHDVKESHIAKVEKRIQSLFALSNSNRSIIKTFIAHDVRSNILGSQSIFYDGLIFGTRYQTLKIQTYKFSVNISDYIDKLKIPPEV